MRIIHVIPGLTEERGGPTAVVQALVQQQSEAGHHVTVLTTDQGARYGERLVDLHRATHVIRLTVRGPDRLAYAPDFARVARQYLPRCDVVHVHSIFTYPVHVALREASACGVPVILRPCGQLHPYSLRLSRWRKRTYLTMWGAMVRQACTLWHYTSEQEAAESWPRDASRNFVLANGIDPDEFAIDRASAQQTAWRIWPELQGAPYVLFLSRIHPKKRLDLLLAAFLGGAPAPFKLVVAGPDECRLWDTLAARLLTDVASRQRVVRIATVSGSAKATLLAGASLFALASEHENFGIAALEAMAAGTPVLLSPNVDVSRDAVRAKLGTELPLDVAVWRDWLATNLSKHEARNRDDGAAREWVRAHYSWERIAAELDGHYQRIRSPEASLVPASLRKV